MSDGVVEGIVNQIQSNQDINQDTQATLPIADDQQPTNQQFNRLDEFEKLSRNERELYKNKKLFSDEREQFDREKEEFERMRQEFANQTRRYDYKNRPSKFLKDNQIDARELAENMLREQEHDGTPDHQKLSPEQALEEAFEKLAEKKGYMSREDYDKLRQQEFDEMQGEQNLNHFMGEIHNILEQSSDKFPMAFGFGGSQMVYDELEKTYEDLAENYGDEYADKWLRNQHQNGYAEIANAVNDTLANGLKNALQYPQVKNFVASILNGASNSSYSDKVVSDGSRINPSVTVRSGDASGNSPMSIDESNLTDQQRLDLAIQNAERASRQRTM